MSRETGQELVRFSPNFPDMDLFQETLASDEIGMLMKRYGCGYVPKGEVDDDLVRAYYVTPKRMERMGIDFASLGLHKMGTMLLGTADVHLALHAYYPGGRIMRHLDVLDDGNGNPLDPGSVYIVSMLGSYRTFRTFSSREAELPNRVYLCKPGSVIGVDNPTSIEDRQWHDALNTSRDLCISAVFSRLIPK